MRRRSAPSPGTSRSSPATIPRTRDISSSSSPRCSTSPWWAGHPETPGALHRPPPRAGASPPPADAVILPVVAGSPPQRPVGTIDEDRRQGSGGALLVLGLVAHA